MNRYTWSVICSPPASFVPVSVPLSVSVSLSGSLSIVGSLFLNFKYSWKIIVGNISRILFQMYHKKKKNIYIYIFIYLLFIITWNVSQSIFSPYSSFTYFSFGNDFYRINNIITYISTIIDI